MGALVVVTQGTVERIAHEGDVTLDDIYRYVDSPFCVGMTIVVDRNRQIDFLVNDEGLFKYEAARSEIAALHNDPTHRGRPHRWDLTFIRPWDSSPLIGPMLICAVNRRTGANVPLTDAEATQYFQAFVALGFQLPEDAPPGS